MEQKKVLIVTYYFPPAGGPGVQRWLKFVKYLPDFDIHPVIYIPENPTYPLVDEQLLKEIPANCTIIKKKIIEPYAWASAFSKKDTKKISAGIIPNQKKQSFVQRMMLWIRGNLFIPDARVLWVKPSVKFLLQYIQENKIDTVITTGPPHSLHLIGLELKRKLHIKWIADFRDPWTTIGYHKALKLTKKSAQKHKMLESEVMNTADMLIVTSPTTKKEFELITNKPIHVITNGYDVENIGKINLDEKFSLAHIGSFLSDRNPSILWEVLSELVKESTNFASDFQLKLIGATSQEVLQSIEANNLEGYVANLGYVSHKEAVEQQRKSQVLLLIEIDSEDTKSIIPGKVFEYIVSGRPIISIGPEGSDFAEIITKTNTGVFLKYSEKDRLKATLLEYYNLYKVNQLKSNGVGLQYYSRKNLTEQLSKLI